MHQQGAHDQPREDDADGEVAAADGAGEQGAADVVVLRKKLAKNSRKVANIQTTLQFMLQNTSKGYQRNKTIQFYKR